VADVSPWRAESALNTNTNTINQSNAEACEKGANTSKMQEFIEPQLGRAALFTSYNIYTTVLSWGPFVALPFLYPRGGFFFQQRWDVPLFAANSNNSLL
jgi:hypothetical protein